ncbi:ATP-binding protein [Blastomonas sp. SL216]|uniref:ATP-binding protein n=1 Tax=Blastomonas sp. SL216 TaxID=2995169 RepID=UPI0023776390|nr:ATP-binding protein [Blastomonas sp. SL216]
MLSVNYPQGFRVVMPFLWPIAMVALMLAMAASSVRLVAAPGFDFYLGPLFYLLAYRWFGVRAGVLTAVVTTIPTLWWWGQPTAMLFSLGHVLAIRLFSGEGRGLSTVTFFYQSAIGLLIGLFFMLSSYQTPVEVAVVMMLRRVLCETLLAALADIIVLAVLIDPSRGKVRRARNLGLQQILEAVVSLAVAGAAALFLLGELNHVNDRLELHQKDVGAAVMAIPNLRTLQPEHVYKLKMHGVDAPMSFVETSNGLLGPAAKGLGCRWLDAGQADPGDRDRIGYWLNMCYAVPVSAAKTIIVSPKNHVITLYQQILRGVLPLMAYLTFAQIGLLVFGNAVRRTTHVLSQALHGFGRGYVSTRPTAPFREADQLLGSFIAANNEFVAFERQREHLMRTVEELRSAIDLKLLSDIRFDATRHELRYAKVDPAMGRRGSSLAVHSADAAHFETLAGQNEIMVEFRRGRDHGDHWYLLLARDYDEESGSWRYGCLIRLRTAKAFQTQMRHGARLMELGGMASALSHELRQPLFTISLAAENALLLLEKGDSDPERLAAKFGRIVEQVARANAIIQHTSAYTRTERDERVAMELGQAVHNAVRFMRPVMTERHVDMQLSIPDDLPTMLLPKVGIEQIIVNALQNAADSIDARRETEGAELAGLILLEVIQGDDGIELFVRDNGAGLDPAIRSNAFNAFCTTKPEGKGTGLGLFVCRQIMDEVGGSIAIADNADAPGASLTLRFPVHGGY